MKNKGTEEDRREKGKKQREILCGYEKCTGKCL
jgi:hypothetical protein